MKRDYQLFIKDALEAMESIENFVEGMTFEELTQDDKTSSAVIRKFEIIGEATKHVPEELKEKYSEIPWKNMAGMRDRLIHAYFGIDCQLVWDTIKIEIPKIKKILNKILVDIRKVDDNH